MIPPLRRRRVAPSNEFLSGPLEFMIVMTENPICAPVGSAYPFRAEGGAPGAVKRAL